MSHAGPVPVLALGEARGLDDLIAQRVTLPAANVVGTAQTVVAGAYRRRQFSRRIAAEIVRRAA